MFTRRDTTSRSSLADIKPIERPTSTAPPMPPQQTSEALVAEPADKPPSVAAPPATATVGNGQPVGGSFSVGSIIGSDLTIMGQGLRIVTRGRLQVDGRIEGDVAGHEVIVGPNGHVEGVVSGMSVIVQGSVNGTVKGVEVTLQSSARVEGDVHHQRLAVEQGAHLDGRVRRPSDLSELKPNLGSSH